MKNLKVKKRNCMACQAFNDLESEPKCELRYIIEEAENKNGLPVPQPKGPCPRPLSKKGFQKHMYKRWKKNQNKS